MGALPDSRLKDPRGVVRADWTMPDGRTVRLNMEPIFCINCGKPAGYVPQEVMSFVSWLCEPCAEKWGEHASGWATADAAFWALVAAEMKDRFGHVLTQAELTALAEQGRLGTALEKLDRESPYRA